jgi:DNA invertase Pin-like site-specific DNA recombinase
MTLTVTTLLPEGTYQGKIQGHHRERLAVVYVRQSTVQQLERHQESTRLQYQLVDRALGLGWPRQQVVVIDEDLGKSGATAEGRTGFQRLVAQVSLAQVGLVLGVEMSRLARSNRDWHQLLEVCALFGTLLGDLDGIYNPQQYNDRLLLGLKGTMSEAELHLLKQRMLAGKEAKAQRGELNLPLPMGYLRRPSGEVIKDPDAQVQATIDLIFTEFTRRQTINGVLQTLVQQQVQLPHRVPGGPRKGELEWRRPTEAHRQQPGRPATGRVVARPEQWRVALRDRLPAYITWEEYQRNQRQLAANQVQNQGAVRQGPALLSGLLVCGRCGLRMAPAYNHNGYGLRYHCSRMAVDYG